MTASSLFLAFVAAASRAASRPGRAGRPHAGHSAGDRDLRPQRHGGGAGEPRRPHRRRDPRPRRQRGRCGGRGRLRHGGHLSARRQSRRRRLHGDPSRQRRRHHDRLSRDRAGGGDADHVPRRQGQSRSGEVARLRACHRRARHGGRPRAGAREIRLRQVVARRSDRAGAAAGAAGLAGRGRHRRLAAARAKSGWRAGRRRQASSSTAASRCTKATGCCSSISPTPWSAIARRRPARLLRGPHRRGDRVRGARRRRHHDGGRPEELPRDRARAGARQLSRLRHRRHAAAVFRRRGADRDAQHPGGLRSRQARRASRRCTT